jgi:hypothetical protein
MEAQEVVLGETEAADGRLRREWQDDAPPNA